MSTVTSNPTATASSGSTPTNGNGNNNVQNNDNNTNNQKPLTIGVFGGSFNPIHLGHALVAVTTQQTKDYVDQVVLVPVFKHAVKRDLLPFDDRVKMCELAVQHFPNVQVSTVERDVGASNGAMLQGLKTRYPAGTRFVWICGDDFFRWMHRPKGLETLAEVDGLIVQRRLHQQANNNNNNSGQDTFYKDPIDEQRVKQIALQMNLEIDYIYGELPHFSSTLVRRAPGHWRSFLTNAVVSYLDQRPHLLQQLMANLEADAVKEQQQQQAADSTAVETKDEAMLDNKHQPTPTLENLHSLSALVVLRGLEVMHLLQKERGHTALFLSTEGHATKLQQAQEKTDRLVQEIIDSSQQQQELQNDEFVEVRALAAELERIPLWLDFDRQILSRYATTTTTTTSNNSNSAAATISSTSPDAWLSRLDLVEKFDARIDVLMSATVRALTEILQISHHAKQQHNGNSNNKSISSFNRDIPELFQKWLEGKEALGRERAFVCSGGPAVPDLVRTSLKLRQRTLLTIDTKERKIARVLSLQAETGDRVAMAATPEALHGLLEQLTRMEYTLLGVFGPSTPVALVHRLLATGAADQAFDVKQFFQASTAAIDFLLSFAKALAASALASA